MTATAIATMKGLRKYAGALLPFGALAFAVLAQLLGEDWALAAGIVLFVAGLSHGAGDENDASFEAISPLKGAAYVLIGLAVAGLYVTLPLAGLTLFLLVSAWHFGRSDSDMDLVVQWSIAGLAIGGSALFRPEATSAIFSEILGRPVPAEFVALLALAGIGGSLAAFYAATQRARGWGVCLAALGACAMFHPVLAVGLIFLIGHAWPVQSRQIERFGLSRVIGAVGWTTALATLGAFALLALVLWQIVAIELAAALAMGLATPHMLTERLER